MIILFAKLFKHGGNKTLAASSVRIRATLGLLIRTMLAPIQLCRLTLGQSSGGREGFILPTVPSCHRILATHGTLPHLLLIHFITLHCYLPSCCDLHTVTATWTPPLLSNNTRGRRIQTTQVLSIQAFVTGRPRATEWGGLLLGSGFVRKLPKGHWPPSISGQHAKRSETRGHF